MAPKKHSKKNKTAKIHHDPPQGDKPGDVENSELLDKISSTPTPPAQSTARLPSESEGEKPDGEKVNKASPHPLPSSAIPKEGSASAPSGTEGEKPDGEKIDKPSPHSASLFSSKLGPSQNVTSHIPLFGPKHKPVTDVKLNAEAQRLSGTQPTTSSQRPSTFGSFGQSPVKPEVNQNSIPQSSLLSTNFIPSTDPAYYVDAQGSNTSQGRLPFGSGFLYGSSKQNNPAQPQFSLLTGYNSKPTSGPESGPPPHSPSLTGSTFKQNTENFNKLPETPFTFASVKGDAPSQPGPIFGALATQNPKWNQGRTNVGEATFTLDEYTAVEKKAEEWRKHNEFLSKRLKETENRLEKRRLKTEASGVQQTEGHSEVEHRLKAECKELNTKISAAEADNAELQDKFTKTEAALRAKIEQGVKDAERIKELLNDNDETTLKLGASVSDNKKMEQKAKTQTNQVIGAEKALGKCKKAFEEYKATAEAKEADLQDTITSLQKGIEERQNIILKGSMVQQQSQTEGFTTPKDGLEDTQAVVDKLISTDNDLAGCKKQCAEQIKEIEKMEEKIRRLTQSNNDLRTFNQGLRNKEVVGSNSSNEREESAKETGQRSLEDEGMRSGDSETDAEQTITIRNLPPSPVAIDQGANMKREAGTQTLAADLPLVPASLAVETPASAEASSSKGSNSQDASTYCEAATQTTASDLPSKSATSVSQDASTYCEAATQTTTSDLPSNSATSVSQNASTYCEAETQTTASDLPAPVSQDAMLQTVTLRPTTVSRGVQTETEDIEPKQLKRWYQNGYIQAIFGTIIISAFLMLLFWAWSQCQLATKERKMWMLANDHAYRLSDEVIRKQALALLMRTEDRAKLGWLTPEKIIAMHREAHRAFARPFDALVPPTRSISIPSLVQSAMAPSPAGTESGAWSQAL